MLAILAQATQPAVDAFNLLTRVDAFYNNAWTKLVAAFGIGGFIVGVVVPLVIQRIQQSSFRNSEEKLRDEWERSMSSLRKELDKDREEAKKYVSQVQAIEQRVDATEKRIAKDHKATYKKLALAFVVLANQQVREKERTLVPALTRQALSMLEIGDSDMDLYEVALQPLAEAAANPEARDQILRLGNVGEHFKQILKFLVDRPELSLRPNTQAVRELIEQWKSQAATPQANPEK